MSKCKRFLASEMRQRSRNLFNLNKKQGVEYQKGLQRSHTASIIMALKLSCKENYFLIKKKLVSDWLTVNMKFGRICGI